MSPGSCKGRRALASVLLAAACLAACSRERPHTVRIAVPRFENLSGDASLEWMGRAFSEVVAGVSGSPGVYVVPFRGVYSGREGPLTRSAERAGALASGAQKIVHGEYWTTGGRLYAAASVEDTASGKIARAASASGPSQDVAAVARALAVQLQGAPRPFGTANMTALRLYAGALEDPDPQAAGNGFEQAAGADPAFGQAWLAAISAAAFRRDGAAAARLFQQAAAHRDSMTPLDRARLDLEAASLAHDREAQRRALGALTELDPADPGPYLALSTLAQASHDYRQGAALLRSAAALSTADPALLNNLGYAEAYAGNLDAAAAALNRVEALRPRDPNTADSLGDVHLYAGRLADAERFYREAYARNPGFQDGAALFKAATARLMTGDAAGAQAVFDQYMSGRAGDPLEGYRRAEWLWLSGRRAAAESALDSFASAAERKGGSDVAALARAHLAIWRIEGGDAAGARAEAGRAAALAGPASAGVAAVANFLAQPAAPASEWNARAARAFAGSDPAMAQFALACALLYAGEFRDAIPVAERMWSRWTPAGDPAVPVVAAWAYAGAGRLREAAAFIDNNPIPQGTGLNPFTCVWFPRLFGLRAQSLDARGRAQDAARYTRLYTQLSGR